MKKIKKICAFILSAMMIVGCASPAFAAGEGEIDYSDWSSLGIYPQDVMGTIYLQSVKALMDIKAITGDTDGLFHPEKSITRAEFCAIVARTTNQQYSEAAAAQEDYFNDLKGYDWAKGYINRCYEQGWIKGDGTGGFNPGGNLTYAQSVTILIRIRMGGNELAGEWPRNYIEYADAYNMTGRVSVTNWNANAPKGDVAIMTNHIISPSTAKRSDSGAAFDNVTIDGTSGTPIASRFVRITLDDDTFNNSVVTTTDVRSWFTGLPTGIAADVTAVSVNRNWVEVTFSGTPTQASTAILSAKIPATAISGGSDAISVSSNSNAKFNIVAGDPAAQQPADEEKDGEGTGEGTGAGE